MTLPPALLTQKGEQVKEAVDRHITVERIRRYVQRLAAVPAPSTASAVLRGPIIESLLYDDGLLSSGRLHYVEDYLFTGNTLVLCGENNVKKPIWYLTHLDTISYLVHPKDGNRYPLVPFCNHLADDYPCPGLVYRYDARKRCYAIVGKGKISTISGRPFLTPSQSLNLVPGDRVVLDIPYREETDTCDVQAHLDNAGAVAALLCAAPILGDFGVNALLAFTDEEEGPMGSENQVIGRGGSRLANILSQPEISIVGDMQQAGGATDADIRGGVENSVRIGSGAVLSEFASLARGAVTPPHLYVAARDLSRELKDAGVRVQESNNAYTSRSDDISVMLRTPNVLLLGFPGVNRHCDHGLPRANLRDIVDLAKAFAYFGVFRDALQKSYPNGVRDRD